MAKFMEWADRHMIPLSKLTLTVPEQTPEPEPTEELVLYDPHQSINNLSKDSTYYDNTTSSFVDDKTYFTARSVAAATNWVDEGSLDPGGCHHAPANIVVMNSETGGINFIADNICIYYNDTNIDITKYSKIQLSFNTSYMMSSDTETYKSHNISLILNENKMVSCSTPNIVYNGESGDSNDGSATWEFNVQDIQDFSASLLSSSDVLTPRAPTVGGYCTENVIIKFIP